MKIVLAGSPELVLSTFKKVIKHFDVVAIVTNCDKPKGRGLKVQPTAVALLGQEFNIKVFKTNHVKELFSQLQALEYDLLLTFAFGQYIPEAILKLGQYRPLNIHGSILPRYRGAAPVQYAILNNDREIGISLIEMTKEMDAGDIYFVAKAPIDDATSSEQGFKIISDLASDNIVAWLKAIENKTVTPYSQGKNFSLSPKISKEMVELTSDLTTHLAMRKIKAFNPWPGAFIVINGQRLKVFDASFEPIKKGLELKFKDGYLWAMEYQYENKKRQRISS